MFPQLKEKGAQGCVVWHQIKFNLDYKLKAYFILNLILNTEVVLMFKCKFTSFDQL